MIFAPKTPFTRYRYVTLLVKNHYVFNCSHHTGRVISRFGVVFTRNRMSDLSLFVCFSYLKFKPLLLTIFIACHEDVRYSINRNETLTVRRSHGSLTVEFHDGFKLLRYVYRLQTLTVSITVSHNFIPASCERNP